MKTLLFTLPMSEMKKVYDAFASKTPKPLNTQFAERATKDEAVKGYMERCNKDKTALFPSSRFFVTFSLQFPT